MLRNKFSSLLTVCLVLIVGVSSFAPKPNHVRNLDLAPSSRTFFGSQIKATENDNNDPAQIVGKRIIVKGDVNGGYVRTCIHNEVR